MKYKGQKVSKGQFKELKLAAEKEQKQNTERIWDTDSFSTFSKFSFSTFFLLFSEHLNSFELYCRNVMSLCILLNWGWGWESKEGVLCRRDFRNLARYELQFGVQVIFEVYMDQTIVTDTWFEFGFLNVSCSCNLHEDWEDGHLLTQTMPTHKFLLQNASFLKDSGKMVLVWYRGIVKCSLVS